MTFEWRAENDRDYAWLTYSANYLLRTAGIRWAIDPLTLHTRLPEASLPDIAADLRGMDFVLLTHHHADHLDLKLIQALKDEPILWVIPGFLLNRVREKTDLSQSKVIIPEEGKKLKINGIAITPFKSPHWEMIPSPGLDGAGFQRKGVPEMGYLVEFQGSRWLFPGDIRTYDRSLVPGFPKLNGVFAHIWLGRSQALQEKPPLLEAYCDFFSRMDTARIILTHLEELHRPPQELWDRKHAEMVKERLTALRPNLEIAIACMGDRVEL